MRISKSNNSKKMRLIDQLIVNKKSKRIEKALTSYKLYEKTADIIERMDVALGRKKIYTSSTNSTINCNIDLHGITSTKKI